MIKDKQEAALERFIISVENMIDVEGFNKDTPLVSPYQIVLLLKY